MRADAYPLETARAVGEDGPALVVVPIVEDLLEQVDIALGHVDEEVAPMASARPPSPFACSAWRARSATLGMLITMPDVPRFFLSTAA